MPTLAENQDEWNATNRWKDQGDEWSATWGGAEAQWYGAIFPRIHAFLPTGTILEIAPGFGRWTQFLKDHCKRLVAIDMAENCITTCKERFADTSHIEYHVNDGKSLSMVPDRSVDFAFTFDSLVHAESDVIEAYLRELSRTLAPNGIGFIHHSNVGDYRRLFGMVKKLPWRVRRSLDLLNFDHWRAYSMTAETFESHCRATKLRCISQELVNWGNPFLIDCLSVFTPEGSTWSRENRRLRNFSFQKEAAIIARLAPLYSRAVAS